MAASLLEVELYTGAEAAGKNAKTLSLGVDRGYKSVVRREVIGPSVRFIAMHMIWPPPASYSASGPPIGLASNVEIVFNSEPSPRLAGIRSRYHALLLAAAAAPPTSSLMTMTLREVRVRVTDPSEALNEHTCYNYSLTVQDRAAEISTCSVYGAAYALESLVQLAGPHGALPHSRVAVHDAPMYKWRGLMIDSGRRFFPVPLVENLLDTMAAVKLNVLHLHASDFCRWSVESKLFPNLTGSLSGVHAGHYSQADIHHLISYAGDRYARCQSCCNRGLRLQHSLLFNPSSLPHHETTILSLSFLKEPRGRLS